MPSFVTHLESAIDGTKLAARTLQTTHADRPLWVRYDLPRIRASWRPESLKDREPTLWRYRELLPIEEESSIVTFGEGMTPLLPCPRLGKTLDLANLWIKDESQLPTGSFKSRGMAMAISMAKYFGVRRVALPSAGNAGGAAAAYGARAGMEVFVFMPRDTPLINQYECVAAGARTFVANGLIHECGRLVREGKERMGWFDLSTLKEPYRIEGKKTMGLELAEQCHWELPDVILYPTGGGTGLIGMWKAFQELAALGWLSSTRMPRMVVVQSQGCCPIVTAYDKEERFAELHQGAVTIASGIRVPMAIGDFMMLDAVRASRGCAVAVAEDKIQEWMKLAISQEGIAVCPEAAACVEAAEQLRATGWIEPQEKVVIFNTGAAQKYLEAITTTLPEIDLQQPMDWQALMQAS
jgi:threonine synthase